MQTAVVIASIVVLWILCARGLGFFAWVLGGAALLGRWGAASGVASPWFGVAASFWLVAALLFGLPKLRRAVISPLLMRLVGAALPKMGETERIALEAGTVWWDRQLFSGRPDWRHLLTFRPQPLSEREKAFLAGPVEELCRMADDWAIVQRGDLDEASWAHLKRHRFLGLIIPEKYGGHGFSAAMHGAVVTRLSSCSVTAAVSVMVPNSLGPAELLHKYGTEEQKAHWLPRLARGEEIPCFALTGPENGSDAVAMGATGVVCHGTWEGRSTLGLRLDWDKRYTTLGPRATVLGLAFRLLDPQHLLGADPEPGITVALVPAQLPGIEIGDRHDPLGVPFLNGPNRGRDVFVPIDAILGGPERAGQGWRMLMDCLAAGRSISLPSLSAGSCQFTARLVSAYALVRRQFNLPIGRFEGVEERLARIAGLTHLADAARVLTAGAVDAGEKPAVLSAICKAWLTEAMRVVVNDGMDVLGGAAISRGPRNPLARAYQAVPIGITVEGANILTRSLIVFGQGAIRCHPFVHAQMEAVAARDVARFDGAFFAHVNHVVTSAARAPLLACVDGGAPALPHARWMRRAFGRLGRSCNAFALVADVAMATLGGSLKRREMLSGRLADVLAWNYLATAVLHRHAMRGEPAAERDVARWAVEHCHAQSRAALVGVLDNLPIRPLGAALRLLCFPFGARARGPSDALSASVARDLLEGPLRESLTRDVYVPPPGQPGLGAIEAARARVLAAAEAARKLREAVKAGKLPEEPAADLPSRAVAAGVLSAEEGARVAAAETARHDAIQVDAYDERAFAALRG